MRRRNLASAHDDDFGARNLAALRAWRDENGLSMPDTNRRRPSMNGLLSSPESTSLRASPSLSL